MQEDPLHCKENCKAYTNELSKQITENEQQFTELNERLRIAHETMQTNNSEIIDLRNNLAKTVEENRKKIDEVQRVKRDIERKEEECKKLGEDVKKYKDMVEKLKDLEGDAEHNTLKAVFAEKLKESEQKLQERFDDLGKHLSIKVQKYEDLVAVNEQCELVKNEQEAQLQSCHDAIQERNAEYTGLKEKNDLGRRKITKLEQDISNLKERHAVCVATFNANNALSQVIMDNDKIRSLTREQEEDHKINILTKKNNVLNSEVRKLHVEMSQAVAREKRLQEDINNMSCPVQQSVDGDNDHDNIIRAEFIEILGKYETQLKVLSKEREELEQRIKTMEGNVKSVMKESDKAIQQNDDSVPSYKARSNVSTYQNEGNKTRQIQKNLRSINAVGQ